MFGAFPPTYGVIDQEGLLRCLCRGEAPSRVYAMELFLDGEVKAELCRRHPIREGPNRSDPHCDLQTLRRDPVVNSVASAEAVLNDMLALQKECLPELR